MSDIEPKKMKVAELREELKTRGLDTKGNKAQLIKRLEKALASEEGGDDLETSQDQDTSAIDSSQDESMNESVTEQPEAESAQVEEEAAQEAEEPEAVQQIETDTKMEADTAMEEAAEPAPEGQEEQAAEGQAVQETGKEEAPAEDEQQEEATESGFPEAEQDGMEDEQQGDFQVMDAVGEDSEAPEADQKMEGGDVKEEKQDASAAAEGSSAKPSGDDKNLKRKHSPSRSDDRRDRDRDRHRRSSHRSRPRSPQHHHSRSRSKDRQPRRGYSPQRIEMEDDTEWLANTNIIIDRYNSDLNLRIEKEVKGSPITVEGFAFMWAGARANFGVNKGKVAFEVKILDQLNVDHLPPEETSRHVLRVGFSTDNTSLQLGEEPNSWGYGGTAKASTDCKFKDYGEKYGQGDVITAYVDFDSEPATIAFSKNGEDQGVCYELDKEALGGAALFPHVLTKNCEFEINYGAKEEPFFPLKEGFVFLQSLPVEERVRGSIPPAKKEDCEMIMMCGLPGAGKTYWAIKHADANREKKYNILGTNSIIDKMKVMGLPRKKNYAGRWDVLIDKATKCLNRLFEIAARKKRNYILDQTNVYPSAQRRKMRPFEGFQRKAVVIVPSEEEFKKRTEKREKEEGKEVPDSAVLEMKANFALPEQGPLFDEVEFVELPRDEAKKLVDQYNKEGQAALPPQEKRFRYGDRDRGYGGGRYDRGRDNRGYGGYDRDNRGYGQGDRGRRQGSYMGYSQSDRDRVSGKYNRNDSRDNRGYDRNDNRSVGWGRNQGSWNQNQSGGNWNRGGWGNQGSGGWGNQGPWGNQGTWGNQGSWGNQGGWGGQWAGYNQGSGQDQWGQGYNYNWGQGYNYNQPGGSQGSYGSGWNYGSYQNK